jgi:hypothetical protein
MADRYVGTVQYTAVPVWTASTAYTVGQFVRQAATPTVGNERVWRCTTAGTSGATEPTWVITVGGTTTDSTVTWTEVTGNSLYGWSAAHARLRNCFATGWTVAGDNIYVASNHNESSSTTFTSNVNATDALPVKIYSIDPAGSVPPVAANVTPGATILHTNAWTVQGVLYFYGFNFRVGVAAAATTASMVFGNGAGNTQHFENCTFAMLGTSSAQTFTFGATLGSTTKFRNCTVTYAASAQILTTNSNTLFTNCNFAVTGTNPTVCISPGAVKIKLDFIGCQFGSPGTGIVSNVQNIVVNFTNCAIPTGVTAVQGGTTRTAPVVTQFNSSAGQTTEANEFRYGERYGSMFLDYTRTRTSGANNGIKNLSWNCTSTGDQQLAFPTDLPDIMFWNDTVGVAVTATIHFTVDSAQTNNQIWMDVHYPDNANSPKSAIATNAVAILGTPVAHPTTAVAWLSPRAVTQSMSVTFTPAKKGFVIIKIKLAAVNGNPVIDPQPVLT